MFKMKYPVDTIIFDFDGVLVDTGPDVANAANFTLRSLGLEELPPQTIAGYIGGGAEMLMRRCLAERADDLISQSLPVFVKRYNEYCCVDTRMYDGVQTVLDHYRQAGKHIAIATQKNEPITQAILEGFKITPYFEVVIGPASVTHRKPHPESLLRILEQIGTAAEHTVMVGDTAFDIQAGKAAGTLTCGVIYGYGTEDEVRSSQPDVVLSQLIQMLDCFI